MSYLIPEHTTKRRRAVRFGNELDRAMRGREVSSRKLAPALGMSRTSVMYWRTGRILPRVDTARRLAEYLDWPRLITLSRELRKKTCPVDGIEFVDDSGSDNRIYCRPACQELVGKRNAGRPVRVLAVRFERALERHRAAVEAFCRGCEPEGRCRDAECALRPISLLPLADARRAPLSAAGR